MFDPRLTVHLLGLRWGARASCLIVLAVAIGGVIERVVARDVILNDHRIAWLLGVIPAFAAILLLIAGHEAIKVSVWQREGATVSRVTLWLFGGIPDLSGALTPRREATGAAIALAALAGTAGIVSGAALLARHASIWVRTPLQTVAIAAVSLAALQLLPALHLDGGHLVRALVWYLTDSTQTANRIAAIYAYLVAFGAIGGGMMMLGRTGPWPFWGLAAVVAGLQLEGATRRTLRRARWPGMDGTVALRDLGLPAPRAILAALTLDEVFETLLALPPDAYLLVTSPGGDPVGVLGLDDLRRIRRGRWGTLTAGEAARPLAAILTLPADLSTPAALPRFDEERGPIVIADGDRPLAVLSRAALLASLMDRGRSF